MRKITRLAVLAVASFATPVLTQPQTSNDPAPAPVFRDPFTLKLLIDRKHSYEEHFDKVPYVADNEVHLFVGESFGVNVTIAGDEIQRVTYQKDAGKADVDFRFTQRKIDGGRVMMMLMITSKLKRVVFLDAVMTVPGKKELYRTSILPLQPELPGLETWPHPIVQLVLKNFRFSEEAPKQN